MAELWFIIQNGWLLDFLGDRVTICFVSKLHAEITYFQIDVYAKKGGRLAGVFLDLLSQTNVYSSVKCIYSF